MRLSVFFEENAKKNQTGFTIIELMIALLVLTLMIGTYVGANIKAQQNAEEMYERTIAIQDANRFIERMRNASRDILLSFPDNVKAAYASDHTYTANNLPNGFDEMTLANEQITATYQAYDPAGGPLNATVTVTWTSYAGRRHTEAVKTCITQR